jgi:hypothetical protein
MSTDWGKAPYKFFAPPGALTVSDPAVQLARDFAETISGMTQDSAWIVTFEWMTSRAATPGPGLASHDYGPGIVLGAQRKVDVPPEALVRAHGLSFAIKIPAAIYLSAPERRIEVDEAEFGKVVLR